MLKKQKIRYYITAVLLLCANLLFAQDIKFRVSVSKTQVGTGEPFEVTFSINGNGDSFTPPDFSGLQLLSGPNVATSMTSINGNTTVSNSYSYDLVAVKEGTAVIGAASMVANGRRLSTKPIRITVVKGQSVRQNSQSQNAPDNSITEAATADLSKSLFLRADADKTTVYQGEQLTLSYRLYTRAGIVNSRVDKLPDLNGFWSQDVKSKQQQVAWRTETYKGQKYNVADVKQTILFPEHAGDITINPFEMTFIARVSEPSNDIMDQFFGASYKDVKYSAKSKPLVIHVKPLPEAGKPAGFSGAVGHFVIAESVDRTELKANETLNYSIKVSGSGNLKLLKTLTADFPHDFEKYDPKITDTISEDQNGVSGSRIYNYLLIPRHQGDFTIEPIQFSYFNPATKRYVTLPGKAFHVKVNKGAATNNVTAFSSGNRQDIQVLDKDIRYIKTGAADLSRIGDQFYGSLSFWLLLAAGPVLCVAGFIYRNQNRKNNSDIVLVKKRRAGKEAAKHLANAQKQLDVKDTKGFYEAVFKGLYGYLSHKLNIAAADLNRENITSNLRSIAINDQLISKLLDTLDLCEMARYAPVTELSEHTVLEKAKSIINEIENEI